jgi:hypothetical protein
MIEPGIRPLVEFLNANSFRTISSCGGGPGHLHHFPTVLVAPNEGMMASQTLCLLRDMLWDAGCVGFDLTIIDVCECQTSGDASFLKPVIRLRVWTPASRLSRLLIHFCRLVRSLFRDRVDALAHMRSHQ